VALTRRLLIPVFILAGLSGCGPSYSPDTYASNAAQQANKVEQGVIVGIRTVDVSAAGTVGTVTGAAAGGIAGSQAASGPVAAFTSLGGALVGGIAGATIEHTTDDTTAFEYIVRKPNNDLISVTQKDKTPLSLGQKVLVITGNQARIIPDYTMPPPPKAVAAVKPTEPTKVDSDSKSADAKAPDAAQAALQTPDATQIAPKSPITVPAGSMPAVQTTSQAPSPPVQPIDTKPVVAAATDRSPPPAQSGAATPSK
jgi:outer membrane lipoprotein SlyB